MRLYEFAENDQIDPNVLKLYLELKTLRGRAASKGAPAQYSWKAISELFPEFAIDYDVFDPIFQANKTLFDPIVHDYSGAGIELDVPGTNKDKESGKDRETSQDKINDIASSSAEKILDKS